VPGANPGVDLDWDPNMMKQKVYYKEEYAADIAKGGHNVVQTVYLECGMKYREDGPVGMRRVGETDFAQSQAQPGLVDGIVGSVDLQLGAEAVDAILAAHLAASPNFKGIRTSFPENLNEQWQSGYRVLGERGLTWEIAFGPEFRKLPILAKLAAAHPNVTMIINHLGCRCDPSMTDDEFQEWKKCRKCACWPPS
jgi:predicted TIM-barrel fold metal-dependent hydrolase